jgi:hypothetical protein
VFLDLVRELDQQGVSRKVGADMFGMALRSYQRKIQRVSESNTDRGRSLWEAIFDYLDKEKMATRSQALARFHRDDEQLVRGVLHDLTESGLIFSTGTGDGTVYRMATGEELAHFRTVQEDDQAPSLDAMLWTVIYREGPCRREDLMRRLNVDDDLIEASLERLLNAARVERDAAGAYRCLKLDVPYGSSTGWEAAVFDHFQAIVKTICAKLRTDQSAMPTDTIGGSTYTFVTWPGHPLEGEVLGGLAKFRERADDLRARVDAYNAQHGIPDRHRKVTSYGGQCLVEEDSDK